MKVGSKSVLFGAHCFFLHPWFVAAAWWKLYGFPWDPRLWVAFFVHDLGYWRLPNMDGEEGELHPYWGANLMHWLFDSKWAIDLRKRNQWFEFTLYHSRFLAKKNGAHFSKLCVADKYSFCLTPRWLYLPMVNLTGEIKEYMKLAEQKEDKKYSTMFLSTMSQKAWHKGVVEYFDKWVQEHKDMREDTWTPSAKVAEDDNGVWK